MLDKYGVIWRDEQQKRGAVYAGWTLLALIAAGALMAVFA